MKHYLIIGRVAGEEFSTLACEAVSPRRARSKFLKHLQSEGGYDDVEWHRLKDNGEVFVDAIFESDSPISAAFVGEL